MRVLVICGDVPLLRALLSSFRKRGAMAWGATRADWALHAGKAHSAAPFDVVIVGPSGSKRRPSETGAEFIAMLRARDPLMPVCMLAPEGEKVPFGVTKIDIDQNPSVLLRRILRIVQRMTPRQGALAL